MLGDVDSPLGTSLPPGGLQGPPTSDPAASGTTCSARHSAPPASAVVLFCSVWSEVGATGKKASNSASASASDSLRARRAWAGEDRQRRVESGNLAGWLAFPPWWRRAHALVRPRASSFSVEASLRIVVVCYGEGRGRQGRKEGSGSKNRQQGSETRHSKAGVGSAAPTLLHAAASSPRTGGRRFLVVRASAELGRANEAKSAGGR